MQYVPPSASARNARPAAWAVAACLILVSATGSAQAGPRLFLDAEDIPDIRDRATRQPYADMAARLMSLPDIYTGSETFELYEISYTARNNATRYLLTGDAQYAENARQASMTLVNNADVWAVDSYRSLSRGMLGLGVAVAYDLCKDAYDPASRAHISGKLKDMGDSLMASGGRGWPSGPGNNWRAVRYSAAGLCYLATDEPVTDPDWNAYGAYQEVVKYFQANLTTDPDSLGWNPEGIGYTSYPAQFWGPFHAAMRRHDPNYSLADAVPGARLTLATPARVSVPIPRPGGWGLHPDFSDDNPWWGPEGSMGVSFTTVPDSYLGAMRWTYDRFFGSDGDQTYDSDRAGVLWSLLYYPEHVEAENPAEVWGKTAADPVLGMAAFRNRYRDADDFVAQIHGKHYAPKHTHRASDLNSLRIWGLGEPWTTGSGRKGDPRGQTTVFRYDPGVYDDRDTGALGQLVDWEFHETTGDGWAKVSGSSTLVSDHTRRLVVDYSGLSGAAGLFVVADESLNGRWWRLNTPEFNDIDLTDDGFVITAPDGDRMVATILHGDPSSLRTGRFERGSSFGYGEIAYDENVWVDFQSTDGRFLVVLAVLPAGQDAPEITADGSGIFRTIHAGQQWIQLDPDQIDARSWNLLPGDANLDGTVSFADFVSLSQSFGCEQLGWMQGDFNGDRLIDQADLDMLNQTLQDQGKAIIPEPTGLVLLALGGLGIRRGRAR